MRRIGSTLLAILLTALMLLNTVSCSDSSNEGEGGETSSTGVQGEVGAESEAVSTEEEKILPNLPADLDFAGAEVRIMQHPFQSGDWADWLSRDLYAESFTGEPINDAVFERNAYVSDKLNVALNVIEVSDMPGAIKKQSTAGTDDYHISTARIQSLTSTATGGYLLNLYNVNHMDLDMPWYDKNCIADASYYGLLYYVTGSMIILDDDSTGAICFNKQLITDFGLGNLYTAVLEGKWTLDMLAEYADAVDMDLNGNGEVDIDEDRFGILWQRDAIISFLHAGGCRIVEKGDDGEPYFSLNTERTVNLMDKIDSFMFDPRVVQNMHNYSNIYPDIYEGEANIFKDNKALFMWVRMRVAENLRDMEADFGIIPVPKFDEAQSDYYSTVNKYTAATVCIPNSGGIDVDLAGAVIEAMSAEGHYGLREAYYENNLGKKIARDPESTEMLDIIMGNRVYDTGEIYNIGSISDKLYSLSSGKTGIGIATVIKQNEKVVSKSLEKSFVNAMKDLAEQEKAQ